ncbi:MAG: type II CAAX endopeptidase family protein [Moheibacter sp.]
MNELGHFPEKKSFPNNSSFQIDFGNALLVAFLIMMSLLVPSVIINFPVKFWPEFYHVSLPLSFLAGGLLGIVVLMAYLKINGSVIVEHLRIIPSFWLILLSVLFYLFSLPFAEFLASLFPTTGHWLIEELYRSTTHAFEMMLDYKIAGFITVCILAPFFEEILFRGILLRGMLQYKMNPTLAIVFSSVLFGLVHMNPWQFLGAGILGVVFAFVYYRTQSLWVCIFLHALNNTVSYGYMLKSQTMEESITNPNDFLWIGVSLIIAVLISFGIYIFTPRVKWN